MQKLFLKERVVDYNSLLDMKEDNDGSITDARIWREDTKYDKNIRSTKVKEFIEPKHYPDICNQLITLVNKWDKTKSNKDYIVVKFNYLIYNKGDHFKRHKDQIPGNNIAKSVYSASTLISQSDDLQGGELIIFDDKNSSSINTNLQIGETAFFDSITPHQVNPVLNGTREVLIAWIYKKEDLEKYNYRL